MTRVAKTLFCQHCGRLFTPKQFEIHKFKSAPTPIAPEVEE